MNPTGLSFLLCISITNHNSQIITEFKFYTRFFANPILQKHYQNIDQINDLEDGETEHIEMIQHNKPLAFSVFILFHLLQCAAHKQQRAFQFIDVIITENKRKAIIRLSQKSIFLDRHTFPKGRAI
jgi:hypothetical protein